MTMSRITSIVHNLLYILSRKIIDIERRLNERADRYEKAVDKRLDERLEAHELRTDKYLLQGRMGIIDRTDVMLQIFEQRLDQQRREIRDLREALAGRDGAAKTGAESNGSSNFDTQQAYDSPADSAPPAQNSKQSPADQILSFHIMHYLCLLAWRRVVTAVETAPSISTSEPQLLQVDEALL